MADIATQSKNRALLYQAQLRGLATALMAELALSNIERSEFVTIVWPAMCDMQRRLGTQAHIKSLATAEKFEPAKQS